MTFQEMPKFLEGQKNKKTNWSSMQYVFINNKNVIVDENNLEAKDWYLVED